MSLDKKSASPCGDGTHPSGGEGSCPHMWAQSSATKVLVESIIAEFYDGRVLVGRGVPTEWLELGFTAENFPIKSNKRMDITAKIADVNDGGAPVPVWMFTDDPVR